MLKWLIIGAIAIIVVVFAVRILKMMLKVEKDINEKEKAEEGGYAPEYINPHSTSDAMRVTKEEKTTSNEIHEPIPNYFNDDIDNDFEDYSNYAHNSKGKRRHPEDFDLEGELADEYIPDSPDFSYLPPPRRRNKKKPSIKQSLEDMPTELKVLMLSDIFDRKF